MFLETLDVKANDIVIFSQNKFDFENNFWMIPKNKKEKIPQHISYFDICDFVKNDVPKNLVIYRLLTNSKKVDAFSTKFGYFLNIDGEMEIIYFDPVFALKDLNHLKFEGDKEQFRFKIQQLGLTSVTNSNGDSNFSIVYTSNLRAYEAENQNDRIFTDAIFAFDESYNNNMYLIEKKIRNGSSILPDISSKKNIYSSQSKIIEVQKTAQSNLNKLDLPDKGQVENIREKKMNMLKQALGISEFEKSENIMAMSSLNSNKMYVKQDNSNNSNGLLTLFKSAENKKSSEIIKDSFVLKISNKK